jgi:hypothetical protein
MRVLHEAVLGRFARLDEGRSSRFDQRKRGGRPRKTR